MNTFSEKFSAQPLSVVVLALWLAGCGQGAPTNGDAGADQTGAQVSEAEPTVPRFGGVELAMPADTLNANPKVMLTATPTSVICVHELFF